MHPSQHGWKLQHRERCEDGDRRGQRAQEHVPRMATRDDRRDPDAGVRRDQRDPKERVDPGLAAGQDVS
jgi:hypothetical protein